MQELEPQLSTPEAKPVRKPNSSGLRPGHGEIQQARKAPLHERASIALGGMFGEEVREVAYCVAESVKRGSMSPLIGRMIIERVLPSSRPIQLDLPEIKGPHDVIEAEGKIVAAMNAGRISPAEARTLQSWAKAAYRARRIANADMGRRG